MAFNDESDYNKARINLFNLLPEVFQSDTNKSIFETLFNRFLSKNETIKVSGYVGEGNPNALLQRQIPEPTPRRQAFQLQPILYSKIGTVEHMMAFTDVLNEISRLGVDTNKMKEWGNATQFNWAPPIDLDKIINYYDYYWYDPDSNYTSSPQYATVKNPCATAQSLVTEFERVIDVAGDELTIVGVNATDNSITVNVQAASEIFIEGFVFFVRGSTNLSINETYFTVASTTSVGGNTEIFVQQDITSDAIADGVVSLAEQLALLQTARDIACTGGAGWDVGLWDDNQVGTVLWNTALLAAISHPTLASWITANGAPSLYDIWYNTTADTLQQYVGGSPSSDTANWTIVQGNFSVILSLVTGSVLWDQIATTTGGMNPSIQQWIDENKWLHKNDVPNFTVARRAALPIIEYYPSVEINEWTYTTYNWKYRPSIFDPWEQVDSKPFLIELLDPDYITFRYEVDAANQTLILDERYGDLTSNFTPGTAFFIENSTDNDGAYTVEYSTYAVDSLGDVGVNPYRTRIKVVQTLNIPSSSPETADGNIRPGVTSRGDPFAGFGTHWVFAGIDEVLPVPHQPQNLLLATDPTTNTATSEYTTTYGPYAQEYITTIDGVTKFVLNAASRPDSTRTLQELAIAGFNDVRVYKNGIRQYGNYKELVSGSPLSPYTAPGSPLLGSPNTVTIPYVVGVEFDATSPTITGDIIRVELGEASQDDLGSYLAYVRTDEDESTYLANGKTGISLIHYRKEEQVKSQTQQYPLFDIYNLDGTPAYRASPIFAFGISQDAPVDSNTGWRIVKSNDLKNYQFEQFLIDEDDGPMFAYRDYTLISTQYWDSVERLLVDSPLSDTANVHTWLGETWTNNSLQMNVFYMKPILSREEPNGVSHPQFTSGSPGVLLDGVLWYDLETQTLYAYDSSNVGFPWDEITDKVDQVNDPAITTIWRTGHPTPTEYVPKYVDGDRVEVSIGDPSGDWEIPNQLYYNPHHENRRLITLRELLNHFNGIIQAQPQIPGYVGGKAAQWRLLSSPNFGLGGTIHEYNDSYDSFLSATFEKNVTPLGLFEFAHDQYETSLNELKEIYRREIVGVLTNYGSDFFNIGSDIADSIIEQYELDDSRAFVYGDSTAFDGTNGIRNWIATLPMFFLYPRKAPYRVDDEELGIRETLHHDGHRSTVRLTNVTTESVILQTISTTDTRTTNENLGVQSTTPPPTTRTSFLTYFPSGLRSHVYWYHTAPGIRTLYRLQIKYVQPTSPPGGADPDGALWFDTVNDTLKILQSSVWVGYETVDTSYTPNIGVIDPAWEILDVNSILTDVILEAEQRLYDVTPDVVNFVFDFESVQQSDPAFYNILLEEAFTAYVRQSEIEDPYVTIYDSSDAFTWNYVTSNFLLSGSPATAIGLPYSGYDTSIRGGVYQDLYQKVYGTPYPHLEPWILQGYTEKPTWWDTEYLNDDPTTYGDRRWKYIHSASSPVILDGSPLASVGMWENIRQGIIPVGYELPDGITVSTGSAGEVQQYNYMSVNIGDVAVDNGAGAIQPDGLLPPYWDFKTEPNLGPTYAGPIRSLFHLLGTEVIGEDENFIFGDAGLPEWIWRNASQFLYDQLTIAYKMQPVRLIHYTLGIDFLEVNDLQVNRRTNKVYSHRDTVFHGEIYNTNEVLYINGIIQWYVNYNRYLGYDINASDFGRLWKDWDTPLSYQFASFLDTTSFFISSDVIDVTSNDYNITMKRSPGIDDYWVDAFNIAPTRIPPALLSYSTDSDWEFSFDTFSAFARPVNCYAVRRYQFAVDTDTGICSLYTYSITAVDTVNDIFSIRGNQTDVFSIGAQFSISGSTGNDGAWQISSVSYAPGVDSTRITIDSTFAGNNTISDATVDGKIKANYRTLPWTSGQQVYLSTTHTIPSPLDTDRPYFIDILDTTTFRLIESQRDLAISSPIPAYGNEGVGDAYIGEVVTSFTAFEGVNTNTTWYHHAIDTRYTVQLIVPKAIKGIQTLVDVIDGCSAWAEADGFSFNFTNTLTDPDTGRLINWQLEEERFIDSMFQLRRARRQRVDSYEVIADSGLNTFTFQTNPPAWSTGARVGLRGTGSLPAPILEGEGVYIIRDPDDTNQFALAATLSDARQGIALDLLTSGSGVISIYINPVSPLAAPRFEVNAFRDSLWFRPDRGIVADVIRGPYTDVRAEQLFQDQYQRPLRANILKVFRQDKITEFRVLPMVTNDVDKRSLRLQAQNATNPYNYIHMSGGHLFLDGYEHILVLNDCTTAGDLLYDRYIGVNLKKLDLEFDRQPEFTLRPNLGGYFLSQDSSNPELENKLIRNIEASAGDMQTFYDTYRAIETLPIMEYSRGLLGYEGIRDDLRQIQINPKSQFVFWRGMIQYKGAVDPIKAYINSRRFIDARIDEFWTYKVAEFGDAGEQKYPQLRLFASDARTNDLAFDFVVDESETEEGYTGITLLNEARWYNQPDQRALLSENGYLLYFEPTIGERLDLSGSPFDTIIEHGFESDSVIITFKLYEDGTQSGGVTGSPLSGGTPIVAGSTPIIIMDYIPGTGMIEVFADGVRLQVDVDYTEGTASPITTNYITLIQGSPERNISVVYKSGRLLEGVHFERVNSNILRFLGTGWGSISFQALTVWGVFPNRAVFNPAKVRDAVSDFTLYNVILWDPARDIHYHNAIGEIGLQLSDDPARYTNTRDSAFLSTAYWSSPEVGTTWLDTSSMDYVPYYDNKIFTLEEQLREWGRLADFGDIAAYEWVESDVPPSEWDALAVAQIGDSTIAEQDRKSGTALTALFSRSRLYYNFTVIPQSSGTVWITLNPADFGTINTGDATGLSTNAVQVFRVTAADVGSPSSLRVFTLASPYVPEQGLLSVTLNGDTLDPDADVNELSDTEFSLNVQLAVDDVITAFITAPTYTTEIIVDGVSNIVRVSGNDAQTFEQLIDRINEDIEGATVELNTENQIVVMSNTLGSTSSVRVNDEYSFVPLARLFSSLPGPITISYTSGGGTLPALSSQIRWIGAPLIAGTDTLEIFSYLTVKRNYVYGSSLAGSPSVAFGSPVGTPVIPIGFTYTYGEDTLQVYLNGQKMIKDVDYQEVPGSPTSDTIVWLIGDVSESSVFEFILTSTTVTYETQSITTIGSSTIVRFDNVTYAHGENTLQVYLNGQKAVAGNDYEELFNVLSFSPASSPLPFDGISYGTDTIFLSPDHTFVLGDIVLVSSTETLPTGLEQGVEYTVSEVIGTPGIQFRLEGVEVSDEGTGTHTVAEAVWPTDWIREVEAKASFNALVDRIGSPYGFDLTGSGIEIGDIVDVYVNGKLAEEDIIVTSSILVVTTYLEDADMITVIKPKHVITADEAAFDPDVEDDGTIHTQYVEDYDYTQVISLNETSGAIISTYYFWVRATTTRYNRRLLSLAEVEQQLTTVPVPYMVFRGLEVPESRTIEGEVFDLPDRYTRVVVRGLRGVINSDDRYVLRFTRDFTLRDRLEHGKSAMDLKQLHAEWKLFRQEQLFVIDRYLWNKVIEAMAGYSLTDDTVSIPSLERELYDATYNADTRYGLRDGQAFVDGELAKASILAYLTDPDIDFSPTNIAVFFDQESFDTPENIISAMNRIYDTFSYEHTNRMFFSVLHDAFSLKVKYPDIFKTSMIALHGIRILEVAGVFDD